MNLVNVLRPTATWLSVDEQQALYSSAYWNNLNAEREKVWWIEDGGEAYDRLRAYLENSGLMQDYIVAERAIRELPETGLVVADLAAGIGWTTALMSKLPNVGSVHAVDLSTHRLDLLFPRAVDMFDGEAEKLDRYVGSYYELGFEDRSVDVVFLSKVFHHAANAVRLLAEIDRVLRLGGRPIMIGDNGIGSLQIAKRMAKVLLTQRRWCSNFFELFRADDETGDHYYRKSDYYLLLILAGFTVNEFSVQKTGSAVIVADKAR